MVYYHFGGVLFMSAFFKWIGGIISAIIVGVAVFHLTEGTLNNNDGLVSATPKPTTPLEERTFKFGLVTLKNLSLSPSPPSRLIEHEQVDIKFNYDVCCQKDVRIWIRPKIIGNNCKHGASGSPEYSGKGEGKSHFNLKGSGCKSSKVKELTVKVLDIGKEKEKKFTIPLNATYKFK